jgi:hypothetical protein
MPNIKSHEKKLINHRDTYITLCLLFSCPGRRNSFMAKRRTGSEGKTGKEKIRIAETGDHVVSNIHFPSLIKFGLANMCESYNSFPQLCKTSQQ